MSEVTTPTTEEQEQEELPLLEGSLETPKQRVKTFQSITELSTYLSLVRPSAVLVQTAYKDARDYSKGHYYQLTTEDNK